MHHNIITRHTAHNRQTRPAMNDLFRALLEPLEWLLNAVAAPYDERPGLERYAAAAPQDFGAYRTFCGT